MTQNECRTRTRECIQTAVMEHADITPVAAGFLAQQIEAALFEQLRRQVVDLPEPDWTPHTRPDKAAEYHEVHGYPIPEATWEGGLNTLVRVYDYDGYHYVQLYADGEPTEPEPLDVLEEYAHRILAAVYYARNTHNAAS